VAKLKLGVINDAKPMKLTVELSAEVHRDLLDPECGYGQPT
jgi:hypothetical protein